MISPPCFRCLRIVGSERKSAPLVLAAMRVLVNLASAPPVAVQMAKEAMPVLFGALGDGAAFNSSLQLLHLVAACVSNLAHHRRCVAALCRARVPHSLCDLGTFFVCAKLFA